MTRAELFDAIRPFAPDRRFLPSHVQAIDALADAFKIPHAAAAGAPAPTPAAKPPAAGVSKPVKAGALVGAVGVAAAAILSPFVSGWESGGKQHLTAYQDIVGVWTLCDGETLGVKKGDTDTAEGCAIRLDMRLAGFAQEVAKCTPSLRGKDEMWASATSLAYNIGTGAYCKSTVDRQFDAGNLRAACDAYLMWNKAGGRVVQGLANRRAAERALCLKGIRA
jgi:lysozyme